MTKKSSEKTKDRMIHVRLNDKTHKRLKIKAAQNNTTIQQLVEDLILKSFMRSKEKDVRS